MAVQSVEVSDVKFFRKQTIQLCIGEIMILKGMNHPKKIYSW